jgi:hypothetical protein
MAVARRTFLIGEDCGGEPGEEKDSFRFLLGVFAVSVKGLFRIPRVIVFDTSEALALVNAGPRLFKDVVLSSLNACRLACTLPNVALRADRGVKNLLNERGVTGGGLLGFRRVPASETIEGGDEGMSWVKAWWCTGSDRGSSAKSRYRSIMYTKSQFNHSSVRVKQVSLQG